MGISQRQALDCFASNDLIGIGMEADAVRRSLHPDGIVTYTVDHAFVFHHDASQLLEAIETAVMEGAATVRLVTPVHGSMELASLEAGLATLRRRFPVLRLQALGASEIIAIAASAGVREDEVLSRLQSAGLDAIEGTTAGLSPERWLDVHAAAHRAGLRSRACITFGGSNSVEHFVQQLAGLQALQEEHAGFTALSLHAFRPSGDHAEFDQPTAVEYLRTLAIGRMLLDNFENIESSGADLGVKVMQMALRFGANDGGAITGPEGAASPGFTEADVRRIIRDAGFAPVERDALYRIMFLSN